MSTKHRPKIRALFRSERGIALTVALFALLITALVGYGLMAGSRGATRVTTGYTSQRVAFEAAEAGIEAARELLRQRYSQGTTINSTLDEARRPGGSLVNAVQMTSFGGTTGVTNLTRNTPVLARTRFQNADFQVFLNNDRADGVTGLADTNERIMLTAFGSGPSVVGFSAVQVELRVPLPELPQPPGILTLPGPDVLYTPFSSTPHTLNGDDSQSTDCYPAISVTSALSVATVEAAINDRGDRYRSCNPRGGRDLQNADTVENFIQNDPLNPQNPYEPTTPNTPPLQPADPRLMDVAYLTDLVNLIEKYADFTSRSDQGFTFGTVNDPKVVVIRGNLEVDPRESGAGMLVVTGDLIFQGNIEYVGVIYVIGTGRLIVNGGGNNTFCGAALIANTAVPWTNDRRYVGVPTYADNGGGNAVQCYDSIAASGDLTRPFLPLERISYQQLR